MPLYWDSGSEAESIARTYEVWLEVLKEYSAMTIARVAKEWVREAKRKPTPADFLALCREYDRTPSQIKNLEYLISLPEQEEVNYDMEKMNGCPIELAKFIKYAKEAQIKFTEDDQMEYLSTGIVPDWYNQKPQEKEDKNPNIPSREELLAQMTPEQRIAALAK